MLPSHLLGLFLDSTSNGAGFTPGLPGGIVAWIVCYKQRRSEIGGWLLFYYWGLYGGALMTLVFFAIGFENYVPESFADPGLYHLYLLSIVPLLILTCAEVVVGTMLLSVRTWELLLLLRCIIAACVLASLLAIVIDVQKFPDLLPFDAYDAAGPIVWSLYFLTSRRVKHVFRTHDWDLAVRTIHPSPKWEIS
jgi:hypothetical protein